VLGHREAPSQLREFVVADLRFLAQALDERVLAVLVFAHVADVVLSGIRLGVQPLKLCVLLVGVLGHGLAARRAEPIACL
jgi:hypothetical protein